MQPIIFEVIDDVPFRLFIDKIGCIQYWACMRVCLSNYFIANGATGGFTLMCPSMIFAAPHYTSIFIHSGCCPHISVTIVCKYIVTCFATFFSGLKSSSLCYGTWSFCWIHYWSIYSKVFFNTLFWDFFLEIIMVKLRFL